MATDAPDFQDAEFGVDGMGRILVRAKRKPPPFNVATFLATVDGGRTVSTYRLNKRIFLQGIRRDFFPLTLPIDQALKAPQLAAFSSS